MSSIPVQIFTRGFAGHTAERAVKAPFVLETAVERDVDYSSVRSSEQLQRVVDPQTAEDIVKAHPRDPLDYVRQIVRTVAETRGGIH